MTAAPGGPPTQQHASGSAPTADLVAEVAAVVDELSRVVVGKRGVLEAVLAAMLAGGHVLIEDVPGVAKTLMARSFARVNQLSFSRIQFTPDLLPADVTGSLMPSADGRLEFAPGPIFANLVLGDEINRAPPKTQAAVLEAMAEGQVTVDGVSHRLPEPFFVLATQNPIEAEGTYPLPEAQLDRFMVRIGVGYPGPADEREMVHRRLARRTEEVELAEVLAVADVIRLQRTVETVHVDADVVDYCVSLVEATRTHEALELGASPRGTLALVRMARGTAAVSGRDYVTTDDVRRVAIPVLAHRLVLRSEAWVRGVTAVQVVDEVVGAVPVPESLTRSDRTSLGAP
jgi:MoxR-like ATPase